MKRLYISKLLYFKRTAPIRSACSHRYEDGEGCITTLYATQKI